MPFAKFSNGSIFSRGLEIPKGAGTKRFLANIRAAPTSPAFDAPIVLQVAMAFQAAVAGPLAAGVPELPLVPTPHAAPRERNAHATLTRHHLTASGPCLEQGSGSCLEQVDQGGNPWLRVHPQTYRRGV